jgi:tartrate dehydratase alpha subunit/fumarate hydratase class I-like protein
MGVRMLQAPCHIANLPVALSVNCHALRRKVIEI